VVLTCSNTKEQLTRWMNVQPDLLKHWRATHFLGGCSAILVSNSNLIENWRVTHKLERCSASSVILIGLITGERLTCYVFPIYLVSKIHIHFLQSYLFFLHNLSGFNILMQDMPPTYCQYSISLIFAIIQHEIVLTF
jgi:hypothetical protein